MRANDTVRVLAGQIMLASESKMDARAKKRCEQTTHRVDPGNIEVPRIAAKVTFHAGKPIYVPQWVRSSDEKTKQEEDVHTERNCSRSVADVHKNNVSDLESMSSFSIAD